MHLVLAWYATGSDESDIILLGEHSLVVLSLQGQLRIQKRFDYQPVAFTTYPVSLMLLLSLFITSFITTADSLI